jgi:hypothetical protein
MRIQIAFAAPKRLKRFDKARPSLHGSEAIAQLNLAL